MTTTSTSRSVPATDTSAVEVVVAGKRPAAQGVVELVLCAPDGGRLRDWTPGSHVDLLLPTGLTRQYSLCGDRRDPHHYRVAVLLEGHGRGGSAYVHHELAVGDRIGVRGPRNNFPLAPAERYLFVAGGIGITPLLPMLAQAEELGIDWRLLYGGRSRTSMAFRDELAQFGDRVGLMPQDEAGLLPLAEFLAEPDDETLVYACGPAAMLDAVQRAAKPWPPYSLRTELFVAKVEDAGRSTEFDIELARTGVRLTVSPGESILDAVGRVGVDVLSSCRQGVCGTCETAVVSGVPDHRDSLLDSDERSAGDCMYVCVSRSSSDLLVLDL